MSHFASLGEIIQQPDDPSLLGQLADYIAKISLVQVDRAAELGKLPTILRLFSEVGPATPQGMSSWDKTFIESLYGTDVTNVTQLSQVKTRMTQALGGTGPDPNLALAYGASFAALVRWRSGDC